MKKIDAEQLICPFMSDNEGMHNDVGVRCITDKCMAWVKSTSGEIKCDGPLGQSYVEITGYSETDGYCERLK